MAYRQDILELFRRAYETDQKKYIKKWLVSWDYQEKRASIKGEDKTSFYTYTGPTDLEEWWAWIGAAEHPDYFDDALMDRLSRTSRKYDDKLAKQYALKVDFDNYDRHIGRYNAQDFYLSNLHPNPGESRPFKVLDFGAGYGRQANLWTSEDPDICYVGMDAIPRSYCLQHLYYNGLDVHVTEYAEKPGEVDLKKTSKGIYHIPTWRVDLLPDDYFDRILCVQVLQELNGKLARYMIRQFNRVLKPSGSLYIRDHDNAWRPTHKLDLNEALEKEGFVLEYRPHIRDKVDLHGIPRIWKKANPKIADRQEVPFKQQFKEFVQDVDAATHGKVKKAMKGIIGKK